MTEEELALTEAEKHNALNPDKAIEKPEDDRLGRKKFAHDLALAIKSYNRAEPFTIGIHGKWGSGKTSVLNMALTEVEKDKNNVIFRFNPWLCNSVQQMISQFFIQLKDLLETKSKSRFSKVADALETYGDAISTISGAVPVLGNIVGGANGAYKSYREAKNDFENLKNIQRLKKDVDDALRKKKAIKIVVVIDDIDRLNKEEIMAVFQLVKALANFSRMFYILAFDKDIVTQALAEIQGGKDKKYGEAYLEKIIQVLIPMPEPIKAMIIDELLRRIKNIASFKDDDNSYIELVTFVPFYFTHIVKSLRDVCRLENAFLIKYSMLKGQTNPCDLLLLTAIQVFMPAVYDKMPAYGNVLCGSFLFDMEQIAEKQRELLEFAPKEQQKWLVSVLAGLFPRFAYHNGKQHGKKPPYCKYSPRTAMEEKHIAAPKNFTKYFTFLDTAVDSIDASLILFLRALYSQQYPFWKRVFSDNIRTSQLIIEINEVDVTGWNHFLPLTKTSSLLVQFAGDWQPEELEQQTSDNFCKAIIALADRLNDVDKDKMFSQLFKQATHLDIAYSVLRKIRAGELDLNDEQKIELERVYIYNCLNYRKENGSYKNEALALYCDIKKEHYQHPSDNLVPPED